MFGRVAPGTRVSLDGADVLVSAQGRFVIGFGRDETGVRVLRLESGAGEVEKRDLAVSAREYRIERVDGLPPKTVTPDPEALERIREEAAMVASARARREFLLPDLHPLPAPAAPVGSESVMSA